MKSCVDSVKKYGWLFVFIFLLYPLAKFGEFFWTHLAAKAPSIVEHFSRDYQYTLQMFEVFLVGIFGTLFGIYKWRDNSRANRNSNLASISVVDVLPNAIASIKNTSTAYGSELRVRIYKPKNFENKHNEEFWKYVADSEKSYCDELEVIVSKVKSNSIEWDSKPVLDNDLSIGEVSIFHLKDAQEPKDKKEKKYPLVHFSLIKVEVTIEEHSGVLKEKFMLFRLARESLRDEGKDDFIKNRLHPYGIWVPVYSWSKWKN